MRYVSIPAVSKRVRLGPYVEAIKIAKANPDQEFKHGLTTWWPTTGAEIVKQFRASVHDRINQSQRYVERGMKGRAGGAA